MKKILLTFIISSVALAHLSAQGCSDAGFCTMGAMKPNQSYSKGIDLKLKSVTFNYYHGTTPHVSPVINAYTIDMNFGFNAKNSFQIKVPYQTVDGKLGSTQGLADLSISATHAFDKIGNFDFSASIGAKIPTGKGDIESNNTEFGTNGNAPGDLPMYYQISLGTYDFIAGASLINKNWMFATGIQIPVIHQNENDFRWKKWQGFPNDLGGEGYIEKYFLANQMKRGTDVMLRIERNFRFVNYNFMAGLLPIYRITKDKRYDFANDEEIKIDGASGLALSALVGGTYFFSAKNSIKIVYGHKLAQRDNNPDGLTRHSVLSISYTYSF